MPVTKELNDGEYRRLSRRFFAAAAGMLVFLCAGMIALQKLEAVPKAKLDFVGLRATGKMERLSGELYRLSYKHPRGTIESRTWKGKPGTSREIGAGETIGVAYDAGEPGNFQPAGASHVPLALAGPLLGAALGLVLYMNTIARRIRRLRT